MITYCYGPDSYNRIKKTNEFLEAIRAKYAGADFFEIDLMEKPESWRMARDFVKQQSMFSSEKILFVRESGEAEEKGEREWVKVLKSLVEEKHVHVIVSDSWEKPRKAFSFLLERPVASYQFEQLTGRALQTFLTGEAKERGVALEEGAWSYFLKFLGTSGDEIWSGVQELEKLALMGFKGAITETQLREVLKWTAHSDAFAAAHKLLAKGDAKKKIMVLEWLLAQGEEPAKLFNLLAYVARGEDAVRLSDLDIAVKSGQAEYEEALLSFVLA